jgi:hypothetical protein
VTTEDLEGFATDCDRLLRLLDDREWWTNHTLSALVSNRFGGRVYDLRKLGYVIEKERTGRREWRYRLIATPEERRPVVVDQRGQALLSLEIAA